MTIAVDLGRKATTKQTTAFLYKTLRDIVLMVDRNKGSILEFIAIVCWIYRFEDNASVYRLCTGTSECANVDQHWWVVENGDHYLNFGDTLHT